MPADSTFTFTYTLTINQNGAALETDWSNAYDNFFQYAVYTLPVDGSTDQNGSPSLVAFATQVQKDAVDSFYGAGVYDAIQKVIIPASLW